MGQTGLKLLRTSAWAIASPASCFARWAGELRSCSLLAAWMMPLGPLLSVVNLVTADAVQSPAEKMGLLVLLTTMGSRSSRKG